MTEIDRRSLIKMAGAGAGLLLAGTAQAQCRDANPPAGGCPSHGQLATEAEPEQIGSVSGFDPNYICVLYVRFGDDKTLKVRTAYVRPAKPFDVVAVARPILHAMRNNGNVAAIRKDENFENLTFGSQHLLVMFIDNDQDEIGFDDRFGDDYVVRFTPLLGRNPEEEARENHAFFNLKRLDINNPGPLRSRVAYQLEFWNTNEEGNPINAVAGCPGTHYLYSMNIHLKIAVKTSQGQVTWVPIILDPDTGNTGGDP